MIRLLGSVGRICDEGSGGKFTNDEAYVMTTQGKEVSKFKRKGGLYVHSRFVFEEDEKT